jgi:precorrin-3B synthase
MTTGDGLLVRLSPAGTIALGAFADLCAAARTHGNGIVEVTARGSIQIRGLTAASAPAFARTVAPLGIDGGCHVSVIADPLAGLTPDAAIDAAVLAAAVRDALAVSAPTARLNPKVSVVIDAGTTWHLDAIAADVRLRAEPGRERPCLHFALGGDAAMAAPLGRVAAEDAAEAVTRLLTQIATHGRDARARDLVTGEGIGAFRATVADLLVDAPAPPTRRPAAPIGAHRLRGGLLARGLGLAFGHADTTALSRFVVAARRAGASGIRAAPGRVLLVIGVTAETADTLTAAADDLGFITRANDPRRHVAVCAGMPGCASAQIATRALAPAIATAAAALLDGSLTLHLSGCGKGCAHRPAAALTVVGALGGCGVIVNGSARDQPLGTIVGQALPSRFAQLAREAERVRRSHERAAETLSRMGAARILAILQEVGGA